MVGPLRAALPVLLGAALLVGCNGGGANPRKALQPPNAVSGGTRGGGRPEGPSVERMHEAEAEAAEKKAKKAEDATAVRDARADALWNNAVAMRERNPAAAADGFQKLANDYKESPHAEMARWREAEARFAAHDWFGAESAAEQYLTDAPCNCHLAEAERVVYEASVEIIRRTHGFAAIWKSSKRGLDGLRFLVDHMPEGAYADDALLALGDEHSRNDDWAEAAQAYKELLLRYPESPLRHEARMRLGDAYLARDQGDAYHAGYVDVDPRSPSSPQYLSSRPIRSTVGAAAAQYQAFLDDIKKDPAASCSMAAEIERAQAMLATSRSRLAAKYREAASYYASHGMQTGAEAYRLYADNIEAGKPWSDDVASVVAPSAAPAHAARPVPPPARAAVPPAPPPSQLPPATAPRGSRTTAHPPVAPPPESVPLEGVPRKAIPPPPPRPPNIVPVPPAPPPEAVATSSSTPVPTGTPAPSSSEGSALPPPRHVSGGGTTR